MERRAPRTSDTDPLTEVVRATRTRRSLLSSDLAMQCGVGIRTVIRVLAGDTADIADADTGRLLGWPSREPLRTRRGAR